MRDARLVQLFDRYRTRGDAEALARVFDQVAPSLLKVARHIDGRGSEAEDLVQTTFLVAIERAPAFDASRPLVPWLMGILINQSRLARRRRKRSEPIAAPEERADSSREVEAESRELARAVVKALGELPEVYRDVLLPHLTQGLEPREIAALLGRPHGTVRAQIHRGIRMMRRLLPAGFAAGAGAVALSRTSLAGVREVVLDAARRDAGVARAPSSVPPPAAAPSARQPITAPSARHLARNASWVSAAALIAAAVYLAARPSASDDAAIALDSSRSAPRELARAPLLQGADGELRARATIVPLPSRAETAALAPYGEVLVHARRARDRAPAAGWRVTLLAWGDDEWYAHVLESVTGDDGSALIPRVHAGRVGIHLDCGKQARVTVEPGKRTEVDVELPRGIDVQGRVVDRDGNAIAGAIVEACAREALVLDSDVDARETVQEDARGGSKPEGSPSARVPAVRDRVSCSTRADGTFELADVDPRWLVVAHAAGHASSEACWLESPRYLDRDRVELELALPDAAATLRGRVAGPDGSPVAGASVRVARDGAHEPRCLADGSVRVDAAISSATTDARGEFALDVPAGALRALIEAPGLARRFLRIADATSRAEVRLERGVTVHGTVRTPDGAPADGALVTARAATSALDADASSASTAATRSLDEDTSSASAAPSSRGDAAGADAVRRTRCDARGEFVLREVPPGEIALSASAHGFGERTSAALRGASGASVSWEPIVAHEQVIRGRAVGKDGRPMKIWLVKAEPEEAPSAAAEITCDEWVESKLATDLARDLLQCWTDEQGRFTVPCRGSALHRLELRPRSVWRGAPHATLAGVKPGASDVVLRYEWTSGWLRGRLAAANAASRTECDVIAVHVQNGSSAQTRVEASNGEFTLGPLPEGRYEIIAWPEQRTPRRLGVFDLARGETLDVGSCKAGGTE